MRAFKGLLIQVAVSVLWPGYFGLLAFSARVGPWPRSLARPMAFTLMVMGWALFAAALARFLFGPAGWAEVSLHMPVAAARQAQRAIWVVVAAVLLFLLPGWILERGLIATGDRPVTAPALCRCLLLTFETLLVVISLRLIRRSSPTVTWLRERREGQTWFARHDRSVCWSIVGLVGVILALDMMGYGFTARRISTAAIESAILALAGCVAYWTIAQAIDHHAWRWVDHGAPDETGATPEAGRNVVGKLKTLARWSVILVASLLLAWLANMDLELVRTIARQPISPSMAGKVTLGDAGRALIVAVLTLGAWRHLGGFFALAVFPRMADDAGIRFAVLTLGRYLVLAVGMMVTMTCLHLGLDRIGVGLAALGVGLGFGLQEIVSNFVSGIILLLERPIRVGDIVTVAGMSGTVGRINIRATTIINADNQSLIVPNREFITSNLVNWTHQDRVIRVGITVGVGYDSDPDTVSDLLLTIARGNDDVLRNPVPMATMDGFGDSALMFSLHVHVADPIVARPVKHRICSEIQKRFKAQGITIPYPTREVFMRATADTEVDIRSARGIENARIDPGHTIPLRPNLATAPTPCPQPAEPSHRGMDE